MKTLKLIQVNVILVVTIFMISLGCAKSPKNEKSLDKDPPSDITINVKSTGAVGDGTTDDTGAFNKAIDQVAAAGGGTVYVPAGTYLIDPDVSISMKSNVILDMVDSTRVIKVKPSSQTRYNVIRIHKISNSEVKGGKINGERYQHIGTTGEWGMGISLYEATNCKVINTVVIDCWGDGIVVGSTKTYDTPNASKDIVISGVISRNNRRQGLTIGGVDSLIVDNCKFTHTNGTLPMAGIDIEPDHDIAQQVYITNCEIAYNAKVGIEMNAKPTTTAKITKITVQNNYIHHNTYSGYIQYVSYTNFTNNRLIFNDWNGPAAGGNGNTPHVNNSTNSVFTPNTFQ